MSKNPKNIATQLMIKAADPAIFFYALLWLMALLIMGTVAEKYVGLYTAQKTYFASYIIWIGGIVPLPGGYTIMGISFVNLLAKLVIEKWTKKKLGTLITHCGALLLLLGGFLTAAFSSEGSMVIAEGESVNFVEDYHHNELAIINTATNQSTIIDDKHLTIGAAQASPSLPFTLTPQMLCQHCAVTQRDAPITDGTVHGMLVANEMRDSPLSPIDEQNIAGIVFKISGADETTNGTYGLFQNMPVTQHIKAGGNEYIVDYRRARTNLPFDIKLIKFTKEVYPGTDKAKSYQSEVILTDGTVQWHSLISMNQPLRYKGYTFYQSSFMDDGQNVHTVLAAVKNIGAIFPYIASLTLCLGLLVHLFIRIPALKIKKEKS